MPFTFTDLITEASIMSGLTALGETLRSADLSYGQSKLNQMIDMWAADRLAVFRSQRAGPFNLTATTQSYTIGTGATWNVARPLWIDAAGIIADPSITYPVELPMNILTTKEWGGINVKTTRSALPRSLWYDRTFGSTGYGTIYIYPVPSTATPDVVLYIPIAVTEISTLTDTVSLPPGYRMALISNLAVLLGIGVVDSSGDLRYLANKSFSDLKASNFVAQMDHLKVDAALLSEGGAWDFLTGGFQ